jgi:hypothetical protein
MSALIEQTATTVVKTLAGIETSLIILFENQQHLSTGLLSRTDERDISARQLHLLLQVKSAVEVARLAVWSMIVPTVEERVNDLAVYRCEPDDEEDAVI